MISDCLVSAVLMDTGAMDAGQVMIFCPAAIHPPVHRVPCVESHGFFISCRVPDWTAGQGKERTLSADTTRGEFSPVTALLCAGPCGNYAMCFLPICACLNE